MNWKDKDIDDLFANAGSGDVPPFDESFWSEMEDMLPDDGKGVDSVFVNAALNQNAPVYKDAYWKEMLALLPGRKRRAAVYWWYSAAGMLLLLSGLGFYLSQHNSGNELPNGSRQSGEYLAKSAEKNETVSGTANELQDAGAGVYSDQAQSESGRRGTDSDNVAFYRNPADRTSENPFLTNQQTGRSSGYGQLEEKLIVKEIAELPKLHTGVSYNMARAPFAEMEVAGKERKFYVQAGAGAGQSFIRSAPGSEVVHFYSLGAGIQKQAGNMYMSFGVQGRVEFTGNIHSNEMLPTGSNRSDVKQLYAIETPVVLAYQNGRNRIGGILTPGFQMGFTGTYITYDLDQNIVSRGKTSGKMPQSRTLTMEAGLIYARNFSDKWTGGCIFAADIIRPVGEDAYSGTNRFLPLNGSVFIRRSF